jgi:hypothetical protein
VEKGETLHIVGGNINYYGHCRTQDGISSKQLNISWVYSPVLDNMLAIGETLGSTPAQ